MRYLKTYNESKSEEVSLFRQNLKDQISDILLDIKDDGFECVNVATPTHWKNGLLWESFEVNIFKPKGGVYDELEGLDTVIGFEYSEVKDSVLHLISFMKTVGYRVGKTIIYRSGVTPFSIGGEVDIPNNKDITTIKLVFEE